MIEVRLPVKTDAISQRLQVLLHRAKQQVRNAKIEDDARKQQHPRQHRAVPEGKLSSQVGKHFPARLLRQGMLTGPEQLKHMAAAIHRVASMAFSAASILYPTPRTVLM